MEWEKKRVLCDYPMQYYSEGYEAPQISKGAFREMDFIKNKLGVEVQFGKYSFMVCSGCAKMSIFHNIMLSWFPDLAIITDTMCLQYGEGS